MFKRGLDEGSRGGGSHIPSSHHGGFSFPGVKILSPGLGENLDLPGGFIPRGNVEGEVPVRASVEDPENRIPGEGEHLRLSFAASMADLEEGLRRIATFARGVAAAPRTPATVGAS